MSLLLALISQVSPVLQVSPAPLEVELYRARMAAAESAMRLGEFAEARAWLEATPVARRGFEWHADHAALDESLATITLDGALADTYAAALDVSPDGRYLAVGTGTGVVELRTRSEGTLIATLGRHAEGVTQLRFDTRGERIVTASYDRTVKVWSVAERVMLSEFKGHGHPVGGAAFSPDGTLVASCSYERPPGTVVGTLHVWNAADGTLVRTMEGGRKPLVGLEWSPEGTHIAAGSWDFCVFVWPAVGGEPVKCAVPDEGLYNAVDGVAWTRDGAHVLAASKDHTARVFDATSGELVASLRGHTDAVSKLALAPDGALAATASADGTLALWSTADWTKRATLRGHGDDVVSLEFAPDGARLHSSSTDGTVRTWDTRACLYGGAGYTAAHAVYVATFSPDGARLATASYDGRVDVRDADTLESLVAWQAHPTGKSCHALDWTSDGVRLVTGSWEPVVRVFEAATGKELAALQQSAGTTWLSVSPDGKLAASCEGSEVNVWNLDDYTRVHSFAGHGSTVASVSFSADSRWCASTARDGKSLVWDAASGALRCAITTASADVAEAKFLPDGSALVVAGRDGKLDLYRLTEGRGELDGSHLRVLARLRHGVNHIDVSPDGTRLAVAANVTVLIDLQHGVVVGEQRRHVEHPYCVDFDPSGTRLATGSTDKTVAIIDRRPLRERL
jgi:WD40 repeat protein